MKPNVPTAMMALLLAAILPSPGVMAQGLPHTTSAAQPDPAAAGSPGRPVPPAGTQTQSISVATGTGVLLRLPQAAATVMSADPTVARVQPASPTSLFLMGASPGRTTVVATTDNGTAIVQYDVTVSGAASRAASLGGGAAPAAPAAPGVTAAASAAAQAAIAQFVSGASGVHVRAAGTQLILEGTVPTAAAAQQANAIARGYVGEKGSVADNLTVLESIQVNVRVRIAEISRTITRQLGFNWQALGKGGNWQFGVRTGAAASSTLNPLLPLGLTALSGASAVPYQIGAGYSSSTRDINGIVDALAADQLITILAEPNLTAQSGEAASFLAGGEFPIPVAGNTSGNTATISVDFKQFGISLAVVPTVLSSGRLNLRVRPEVSQLTHLIHGMAEIC